METPSTFTVTDVAKSKRSTGENIFTGKAEVSSVFIVRTTSNRFPDRHLDLSFGTEAESQRFSKGQTYTFDELKALFES